MHFKQSFNNTPELVLKFNNNIIDDANLCKFYPSPNNLNI